MSRSQSEHGSWNSDAGLFSLLRVSGCPLVDGGPWVQSQSGLNFALPNGIGTAACWLPCVSPTERPALPGTCVSCAEFYRAVESPETFPLLDGG